MFHSLFGNRISQLLLVVLCLGTLTATIDKSSANGNKIVTVPPASISVTEGTTGSVQVQLTEPMICVEEVPDLTLSFSSSDVSSLTVTSGALLWAAAEWNQERTLSFSATNNLVYSGNKTITLTATAVSCAEFYSNYVVNVIVTVIDDEQPPVPVVQVPDPTQTDEILSITPQVGTVGTLITFKGTFSRKVIRIFMGNTLLDESQWTQSASAIHIKTPQLADGKTHIQIYNGAAPVLPTYTFTYITEVLAVPEPQPSPIKSSTPLVCVKGKLKMTARAKVCPRGYSERK